MRHPRYATMVVLFARLVPLEARKIMCRALFRLFYVFSLKHRLITRSNLSHAFPEKSVTDIAVLSRAVYRNLADIIAEMSDIPLLTRDTISRYVHVEEFEEAARRLDPNRGVILFTAHFGNWELLAAAVAILIRPVSVIYRPLDNRLLDDLVAWIRTAATGNRLIPKDRAMRAIIRSLREGDIVGMLIDQNVAWPEGVFIDFFGRPACTTDGLALIASHTGAPVVPFFLARESSGKYRLIQGEPIDIVQTGNRRRDAFINTQKASRIVEEIVRAHPDQWLWMHQRWKTKKVQVTGPVRDGSDSIE